MGLLSEGEQWRLYHGDCIPHMLEEMPESSVDFSVFSPPFPAMYAYTNSEADLGNVDRWNGESRIHFRFLFRGLNRVLKPGRAAIVHCCQIPEYKRTGGEGLVDFRGILIRIAQRCGLVYEYDWLIPKNPQAQAIRTRSRELQFAGLESDRAKSRGSLGDYLIKFRKRGDNAKPVCDPHQVSRNDWIEWAEAAWQGIRETDTLNTAAAKSDDDTRHICPLQLPVINRAVRLYTDPGEIVFSPFAGIGSEGYEAVKLDRRFYGCELKTEYVVQALANIDRARSVASDAPTLF